MSYCDPQFCYETIFPLLIVGDTSIIGISTLRDSINFYTRLLKIADPVTGKKYFNVMQVELACEACKAEGQAAQCKHMLHLIPRWQSSGRHTMLKEVMVSIS